MNARIFAMLVPVCLCSQGVHAAFPAGGTHLFASDFLGSSHELYDDHTIRDLVEGWTGQAAGAGGGATFPYSDIENSILSYRGGLGDFADRVDIRHDLTGIPAHWLLQIRFRRDGSHENPRTDFSLRVDEVHYFAGGEGASEPFGVNEANVPFPLTTGTWYIMEIIETRFAPPSLVRLTGNNYVAPQMSVDWIFIDEAPVIDNMLEMRIWEDGTPRPHDPTVSIVPASSGALLFLAFGPARRRRR